MVEKDYIIKEKKILPSGCALLELQTADGSAMPVCQPGQFVEVAVNAAGVMLRRPISICNCDGTLMTLFVKPVGNGSRALVNLEPGAVINLVGPLGHGFTLASRGERTLLVGGGVGAAPLVMLSHALDTNGVDIEVVLGGRSATDIAGIPALYRARQVSLSTDDGTVGEQGLVTQNTSFAKEFDRIYCCGPTPMMRAVAEIARERGIWCEVSLENMMACGLGACLCCVQEADDHHNVCVCTEGPVFNINRLTTWR